MRCAHGKRHPRAHTYADGGERKRQPRESTREAAQREETRGKPTVCHTYSRKTGKKPHAPFFFFFFPPVSQITNVEMREFIQMLICLNSFPNESPEVLSSSQRGSYLILD